MKDRPTYLFGDGEPSPHTSNVLELLERVLDFCIPALIAADRQCERDARRTERERRVQQTRAEMRGVAQRISELLRETRGEPTLMAWSIMVERDVHARVEEQERALFEQLEGAESQQGRRESGSEDWRGPLETLIARPDLPGVSHALRVTLGNEGYLADQIARTSWGLGSKLPLDTSGTSWRRRLRVSHLSQGLEILEHVREGLGRAIVHDVERSAKKTTMTLHERGSDEPLVDVVFGGRGRIFLLDHRQSSRPLVPEGPLHEALSELGDSLQTSLDTLGGRSIGRPALRLDDVPVEDMLEETVRRLVAQLGPDVAEIERRSPSEGELVLKRVLDAGKREELFVSREELRARLTPLTPERRRILEPLGLTSPAGSPPSSELPTSSSHESTPAGPRRLPRPFDDPEEPREHTAHGPGTPSSRGIGGVGGDETQSTLVSAGQRKRKAGKR